jgi:transposase-like protein
MGRVCSICSNPEREAIDAALVSGKAYSVVAREFGVGPESVRRHHDAHLSPALQAMKAERELEEGASLLQRTQRLIERTERILSAAEQDGKVSTALAAVAQLKGLLDLLGRVTHEIDDRPTVTINLLTHPEVLAALNVVYTELADLPDVRQRIAARLQPDRRAIEAAP